MPLMTLNRAGGYSIYYKFNNGWAVATFGDGYQLHAFAVPSVLVEGDLREFNEYVRRIKIPEEKARGDYQTVKDDTGLVKFIYEVSLRPQHESVIGVLEKINSAYQKGKENDRR